MVKRMEKIVVGSLKPLRPVLANWQKLMDVDFWNYMSRITLIPHPWDHIISPLWVERG